MPDDDPEQREKVIVRSNGTVTYVGKDMAYQFWKSGMLGRDFHYRQFATRIDGADLWATTSTPELAEAAHPSFGGAIATYNVIDVRQSYLQKLLKQALVGGGPSGRGRTPDALLVRDGGALAQHRARAGLRAAARLGRSEEAVRRGLGPQGPGREGRRPDRPRDREGAGRKSSAASRICPTPSGGKIAESLGIAAVRYFLIKYSRTKVIAFDIDEALSFEGESGPYLQYAVVRANNIFQKLQDREGVSEAALLAELATTAPDALNGADGDHELWALVLEASRLDDIVEQVVRSLEFAVLAKYGFGLAQMFNAFYHRRRSSTKSAPTFAGGGPRRWSTSGSS